MMGTEEWRSHAAAKDSQGPGRLAAARARRRSACAEWSSPSPTRSSPSWTPRRRGRGEISRVGVPVREALAEVIRSAGLVRRAGVNLNQAVAKLNATGEPSGELVPYAAESIRRARRLDAAAEELRKRLP